MDRAEKWINELFERQKIYQPLFDDELKVIFQTKFEIFHMFQLLKHEDLHVFCV